MLNKRVLSDFLSGIKSQILILGINKGVLCDKLGFWIFCWWGGFLTFKITF